MDTARMGQACPRASQALCEFARLAAEDPSLYSLSFLSHGAEVWPKVARKTFPELACWQGIANLQQMFAKSLNIANSEQVLLASRTSQLVRLAARVMFRQCHHVLTTDMNWPAWQAIVNDEAVWHGRRITQISLANAVLNDGWQAGDVVNHLAREFQNHGCDGLFIPAITNLGVSLPVAELVMTLRTNYGMRFVLVDAAQAFCQRPIQSLARAADITIVGCHKWLGAHLPMGAAIASHPLVAQQLRCVISAGESPGRLDDPLMSLSEQIQSNQVDRVSETVNITPMFSASAALSAGQASAVRLESAYQQRLQNMHCALDCLSESPWIPQRFHPSMRSAILLARRRRPNRQVDPDQLQSQFHHEGVALTAYHDGSIRLSMPSTALSVEEQSCLTSALARIPG